jgi:hypothetical protein
VVVSDVDPGIRLPGVEDTIGEHVLYVPTCTAANVNVSYTNLTGVATNSGGLQLVRRKAAAAR